MQGELSDIQKAERQQSIVTFLLNRNGEVTVTGHLDIVRLGFKPVTWSGESLLCLAEQHPGTIEGLRRALGGEFVISENRTDRHIYLNSYSPLFDVAGTVSTVIGVSIDVTESRRVEEEFQSSEFRFRKLFNAASDAIFMMDNRTFIDCNAATLRIFQCTREQIIGQTPYRFSPLYQPDGRLSEEAAMEKINSVLAGIPQFFEWRHIRYDGTPFDAEVSLNRLDLNEEVFIQAMVRDISERKRAEEENKLLALVANTTTNMVVIADGQGKIEWVNPAFTRITGYTLDEVVGREPGSFLTGPGTDRAISRFMGERIRAGQGFKDVEILNYHKEGAPYWISIELQPIHDKAGKVIRFIAIESDITERKATQQALLDRHEELVRINTELDRFVYSASHDLRAPIASLLGLIEVARLERNMDNILQLLEMQKRSLLRLDRFIKDIVDHSRNTRLDIESESVNFQAIIHSTFEQLHFMDHFNQVKKIVAVKQEKEFYSSPTRLNIIFNNLISNAIKYADIRKDDPYLKIDVEAADAQVTISISDNGEGIPAESVDKIFDMFFRASSRGIGSGLGLYIVKEAIRKLGGTIEVHSEYGVGTEFTVILPNLRFMANC
jgi:PAS domain S-box-containing protein